MPEPRVFLSHSSRDAAIAQELCARLESQGVACWIAPRDIKGGEDWSAAIPPAIDGCSAMVLVLSAAANASRQIAHEVHLAHGAAVPIVPFRIEPVKPAGALRYLLSGIHHISAFTEPRERAVAELLALLGGLDGSPEAVAALDSRLTAAPSESPRANLPLPLSAFIGRERELEQLRGDAKRTRLLTLVGTGGVGKTRLALAFAAESDGSYEDGVWFVDLSLSAEDDAVASAIAIALSVRTLPGQSVTDALIAGVRDRRLMLVVDGCDRVRDASAELIAAILRSCPRAGVLATSRQALRVDGETVATVGPLAVRDAIDLFADRARAVSSTFAETPENRPVLERLCRRLDSIPLAVELAAAKMAVIGPSQLDEKLDARFRILSQNTRGRLPRHQTLRATIDFSFDLLDERERVLFRRLAIFAGGWTLPAASAICGDASVDEWEVFDVLSSLVEKSLVAVESSGVDQRYRMLYSIRDYALERLAEAGETAALEAAYARFYAAFVRDLEPLAAALEDEEWRRACAAEVDNLRAVIEATIFHGREPQIGLALLADLQWPELIVTPQEALRWFETAAGLVDAMPSACVHARLLRHCVLLEWLVGRPLAERERTARRGVEVARVTRDPDEIARALGNLGACYRSDARFEAAEGAFAEAYARPELLSRGTANAVLRQWAVTDLQRGEIDVARGRFVEVARRERPGSEAHASALLNVGELEFAAGNLIAARAAARTARDIYAGFNSVYLVLVLSNLAAYALAHDDVDAARGHLSEALGLLPASGPAWLGTVLEHHALLAAVVGDGERAVLLAGFTDAHYVSRGEVRQHTERHGYERLMNLLAEVFAAEVLAERLRAGAGLTAEQAIAHAARIHEPTESPAARPPKVES